MKSYGLRRFFRHGWKSRKGILIISLVVIVLGAASAKHLAVKGVEAYQAWISPHKGYHCAHAQYHHGPSCSAYGKEVFKEHGAVAGLLMLKARFRECREARVKLESAFRCVPKCKQAGGCGDCGEGLGEGCGIFGGHFCEGFCDGCGK